MTEPDQIIYSGMAKPSSSHFTSETPSWLLIPPAAGELPPPVQTRKQLLPLAKIGWNDFERICFRLLRTQVVGAVRAAIYGLPGQTQQGIDMYAVAPTELEDGPSTRRHVTLQSRRITNVVPANLRECVDKFLAGKWADDCQKFIYATSSVARSTQILHEVEELAKRLDEHSITFEVWDQERISEMLKEHPELVDDFFGRAWVKVFCGAEVAHQLGDRLDVRDIATLRAELRRIYGKTFALADPGFAGFRLNDIRRVDLLERFVTPDLVSAAHQTASFPYSVATGAVAEDRTFDSNNGLGTNEEWNYWLPDEHNWSIPRPSGTGRRSVPAIATEYRPADQWLGTEQLQVVIGDPGAGKSGLLRYLVLDLLREEPQWITVAEHWGEYLPIWLPFNFLAQRFVGQTGEGASVSLSIKAWLEQNESAHIWPLVEKAVEDHRLLLVVDGLDEWISGDAGTYAARAVEKLAAIRGIPVVASTRPYGLKRLTLDAGWVYSRIAPLNYQQQKSLASHYFRAASNNDYLTDSAEIIDRTVDEFLTQVFQVPELRAFSGTPLFLIMLVMLRMSSSSQLPVHRFDVYSRALQLLVADLPPGRRTAADVTTTHPRLPQHDLEAVLRKVAYVNQLRGKFSVWDENALREDFVDALMDPAHLSMSRESAVNTANQLFDVAEGELGILVRVGPQQLGFIHRVMQEQLAADHIFNKLEFSDVQSLFEEYVGDPGWKEVLLITFRKVSRPSELSTLLALVQGRIDETPSGLCAREFLAEITFGSYGLPPDAVRTNASDIAATVETHAYGPHRARLLDAIFTGVGGPTTGDIVQGLLERWTLLVYQPSRELVAQIARIPPDATISQEICQLLVFALRNADKYDAFDNACTIIFRCLTIGTDEERSCLRAGLLNVVADPPTGLAQASALACLALGWRDDPTVVAILEEAKFHPDEQVRLVAICDALNVLADVFSGIPAVSRPTTLVLNDADREWLLEHLWTLESPEVHFGMLVAAISAAVRRDQFVLTDLLDFLSSGEVSYWGSEVPLAVMLKAFAEDDRVADWVCDEISGDGQNGLKLRLRSGDVGPLVETYGKGSSQNLRVAESIEHFLSVTDSKFMDRSLFNLAAVDQGPRMRDALIQSLSDSSFPHWAAAALVEHFPEESEVLDELRTIMLGNPQRASMVANAASEVLRREDVIPRLMDILRTLANSPSHNSARYDIVASALIRAYRETDPPHQRDIAPLIREAIELIPDFGHSIFGSPRLALAVALYPAEGSGKILKEIGGRESCPLEPFLQAFREDPENLKPFLAEASKVLRSLPAFLRAHICRMLAELGIQPRLVGDLTKRWADEISGPNKSVASFTYHQALVKIEQGITRDAEKLNHALAHLGNQAVAVGPDHEDRRRAAWVGMCVLKDWSPLSDRLEVMSNSTPPRVSLRDPLEIPDRVLLQQVAISWEQLRETFGDGLLTLLSDPLERDNQDSAWNTLALVAAESPALERELENQLAANPQLVTRSGIFMWIVRRTTGKVEPISAVLTSFLRDNQYTRDESVSDLLVQPERLGILPEQLQDALERGANGSIEGLALESLAVLFPSHPLVQQAWQFYCRLLESSGKHSTHGVNPGAYFALAYSVSDCNAILGLIKQHHDRLCKIGNPYIDRVFARYVSHRLSRDPDAVVGIQEAILNPDTSDSWAAVLVSLLRNAVGLNDKLLVEIERRMCLQTGRRLAMVVRDPHAGTSLPVRSIFIDAAVGARNEHSVR